MKARPHLKAATTRLLYILNDIGPGGASSDLIGTRARMRTRQAAQRLRWLQRVGMVRFVADSSVWQLTDDSLFTQAAAGQHQNTSSNPEAIGGDFPMANAKDTP